MSHIQKNSDINKISTESKVQIKKLYSEISYLKSNITEETYERYTMLINHYTSIINTLKK